MGRKGRDLLAAVAAYGLRGSALELPGDVLERHAWLTLLQAAVHERVAGLLARAVDDGAMPARPEQRIEAADAGRVEIDHNRRVVRLLGEVTSLLEDAGIAACVLKGPAHAQLAHREPALRSFVDVDLLVRPAEIDTAVACLSRAGGRRRFPEPGAGFDRRFSKGVCVAMPGGIDVDLHRTLAPGPFGMTVDLPGLQASASTFVLGGRRFRALGPEARFLHACYHAILGDARPRLTALRDVAEMQAGRRFDTGKARSLARDWRATAVLARAVSAATSTLGLVPTALSTWAGAVEPHPSELRWLACYGSRRSSGGMALAALGAIPGARARAGYAWALLLPGPDLRHRVDLARWWRGARALRHLPGR